MVAAISNKHVAVVVDCDAAWLVELCRQAPAVLVPVRLNEQTSYIRPRSPVCIYTGCVYTFKDRGRDAATRSDAAEHRRQRERQYTAGYTYIAEDRVPACCPSKQRHLAIFGHPTDQLIGAPAPQHGKYRCEFEQHS